MNISIGRPVILQKLISHDWKTGEVQNVYDLADYKERWGYVSCFETLYVTCFILMRETGLQYVSPSKHA